MRTKALKALGQIITSDPRILSAPNVRRGIETHLLDSSPAVRDAAVELTGKYMVDSPKFAADYYQKIADRIADTGLGVRKRVIKLLKAYYSVTDDRGARIDISARIVLRMLDEDDTVKDLAVKTVEELWFTNATSAPKSAQDNKTELLAKVVVIMGVAAQFKDRQSPLEDLLHRIMADKSEHDKSVLHQRYVEVCETLIDGLVDASDLPGFVSNTFCLCAGYGINPIADRPELRANHLPFHVRISGCSFWFKCCDPATLPEERNHGNPLSLNV